MLPKNKKARRELQKVQEQFSNEVQSDINKENQQIEEMSTDKLPDDSFELLEDDDDNIPLDGGTTLIH
jgi:hypothetical protein